MRRVKAGFDSYYMAVYISDRVHMIIKHTIRSEDSIGIVKLMLILLHRTPLFEYEISGAVYIL